MEEKNKTTLISNRIVEASFGSAFVCAAPIPDQVAHAIARNYNWIISASGNTAMNQLGLSTQVPANWSYISSDPYKEYTFGNVTLTFSHRSDSQIIGMSEKTLLIIQALKTIGQENISEADIKQIRKKDFSR